LAGRYASSNADSFASLLARTDVLALQATAVTRHVLSATTLANLRPHAVLVNVRRGDATDVDALLAALDAKALAGAALDFSSPEPLPVGHAVIGRRDLLLTSYLSGRMINYWEHAIGVFMANLKRCRAGKGVWNGVDFERGY
jgi:phosphoglycerate dehydrogenase-like enzyme